MPIPSKVVQTRSSITVQLEAFKTSVFFYESIGAEVTIVTGPKAESIQIANTYFISDPERLGPAVNTASNSKTCKNSGDCTLKQYAVGFNVSLKIEGVVAHATVKVGGQIFTLEAALGRQA